MTRHVNTRTIFSYSGDSLLDQNHYCRDLLRDGKIENKMSKLGSIEFLQSISTIDS